MLGLKEAIGIFCAVVLIGTAFMPDRWLERPAAFGTAAGAAIGLITALVW